MTAVDDPLDLARRAMRARAHARSLEVAPAVLTAVLAHPRRSLPVRTRVAEERTHLGERVVVARLRRRVDESVPGVAVRRVHLRLGPDHALESVAVEVIARYGEPLAEAAELIRAHVDDELRTLLGPHTASIGVTTAPTGTDIHVGDVTPGDPLLTDPHDD